MIKKIRLSFCSVFLLLIMLPLLCVNLKPGGRTTYENRALEKLPNLHDDKGNLNGKFLPEFEKWFDDHIGFRDYMIQCNGVIQYYLFDRLDMANIYLGPNGELAAIRKMIDYQHTNLLTEKELRELSDAIVTIRDYLASFGCQFFFMQCWDKHTIYPEQYPKEIYQYGHISRAEQLEQYLAANTDINLVRLKDRLIQEKDNYAIFGEWSDPWHWNPRGAMIAYRELMDVINRQNNHKYKVLLKDDLAIDLKDKGMTYYGMIHRNESIELFKPKRRYSVNVSERFPAEFSKLEFQKYIYMNNYIDNKDTICCLADSYLKDHILSAIAESFQTTIYINMDNINRQDVNIIHFIEVFHPAIVLFERAERGNWLRDDKIINAASIIKSHDYKIGQSILFSQKQYNASKYVLFGLFKPEEDFTWMNGKKLVMVLNLKNTKSHNLRCKLSLAHVFRGKQPVTVKINDKIVYSGIATAKNGIEFSFQNPNTYSMRFEIIAPEASSQAELGIGQNKNILPLAIREMKIFE